MQGAGLALLLLCLSLAACDRSTPEQRLRQQLSALQTAIEAQRINEAMQSIAEDFSGEGGMDRAALHNLMRVQVLGRGKVGVTTGPLDVRMQQDTATVRFDAVLTGGGQGRWLPDSAQAYTVTTGWRQQDGEWRLYHAQWETRR